MSAARGFQQLKLRVIMSLGQLNGSHYDLVQAEELVVTSVALQVRQRKLMSWLSDRLRMYTLKRQTSRHCCHCVLDVGDRGPASMHFF